MNDEIQNPFNEKMKSVYWTCGFSIIVAGGIIQVNNDIDYWKSLRFIWISGTIYLLVSLILELIWRILVIPSEIKLSQENNVYFVIKKVLLPNTITIVVTIFTTINALLIPLNCSHPLELMQSGGVLANFCIIIAVFLSGKIIKLNELKIHWSQVETNELFFISSEIFHIEFNEKSDSLQTLCNFVRGGHGLDYGSGMAYSYFYGYLNIILPNRGDENVGLRENIEKYESKNQIQIPVKKLFILIPDSMYFTPSLESDDGRIRAASNLETLVRNVAGVRERPYKNSVYKIKKPKITGGYEYVYVVAEGATPLHTLHQATHAQGPACTPEMRELKLELVRQFYRTLARVLHCYRECQGTYELIYYNDLDGAANIADLLLERIESYQH